MRVPPTAARGFTLVEVLVALTIMAVMATLSWRGIDGMMRAQESTSRYTDDVLALQAGLMQWQADLDAMMVWPAPDGSTQRQTGTLRSLAWNGQVLRITRMSAGEPAAGLRVVAWTLRPDGQWLRWQSPPILSQNAWLGAWDAAATWGQSVGAAEQPTGGSTQSVRVAYASEWQLHYFRNNTWTNPMSSAAEGSANRDVLPDGVRLLITLAPGQALSGPMVIDWVRPSFGSAS